MMDHAGCYAMFSSTSQKNNYGQHSNVKTHSQETGPTSPAYDIRSRLEEGMVFKLKFTFPLGTQRKKSSALSLEINGYFKEANAFKSTSEDFDQASSHQVHNSRQSIH